ncbi:hypothetical protein SAMN05443144_10357 [Fodinibius roseus]|uniref:Uncharacterized protein n=1 Tax=Fodinibius roseus TaxID=1194090 RepID=A0A1M4VWR8_9BACT|nr:hypothetical protein SAMN05443144_10357 [Fodinibius roseus]
MPLLVNANVTAGIHGRHVSMTACAALKGTGNLPAPPLEKLLNT